MACKEMWRHRSAGVLAVAALGFGLVLAPGSAGSLAAQTEREVVQEQSTRAPAVTVLVVYYSVTGNTQKMARAVAEGVRSVPGAVVALRRSDGVSKADLEGADGMILGSPTYWGNIAAPMKAFIDDWVLKYRVPLIDKVGGAFASGADETGGKENVIYSLDIAMLNGGMILTGPLEGGFGAAGVSALDPISEKALAQCRALGQRVARVVQRVKAGASTGGA